MSELLDKQVNAQKENFSEEKLSGFTQTHEKVCDVNERNKQENNDTCIKMLLMEGSTA